VPTSLDEYIAEHKPGDVVTGRVIEMTGAEGRVELGEGIQAKCRITTAAAKSKESSFATAESNKKADLSSLGSMLQARWKGAAPAPDAKPEPVRAGQIREFRITRLDAAAKQIEVELV
jgi:small subunit ribosomal protein S1